MSEGSVVEARTAAAAAGIPLRRLLGWIARGVFQPSFAGHGRGNRNRFTRNDLLQLAIIAELQDILGPHLRPGFIAVAVAEWIELTGGWRLPSDRPRDPGVVLFSLDKKGRLRQHPCAASNVPRELERLGTAIVVNPEHHMRRIERSLA